MGVKMRNLGVNVVKKISYFDGSFIENSWVYYYENSSAGKIKKRPGPPGEVLALIHILQPGVYTLQYFGSNSIDNEVLQFC